ncbi:MAG TPA: right-handed parallel beta-helix repeat-containing protein [Longimicrobium sp.]|jgi:hypothetical protein
MIDPPTRLPATGWSQLAGLPADAPEAGDGAVFNIRAYGAVGDGKHNDLPAYFAMVAAVNAARGGTALFPPGVYYMDDHQRYDERGIAGGSSQPVFSDCDGLRISGYGAKIDLRGDFHRTRASDRHPIIGVRVQRCRNFVIEGLEIDGNVDRMTRAPGMPETWSHGILVASSQRYVLRDLNVHHHAMDGIGLGRTERGVPDEDVRLENVFSSYNARQALSILGCRRLTAVNCVFANTGRSLPYGGYAPGTGVDVEPEGRGAVGEEIVFDGCRFENNFGGQVAVGYPHLVRGVRFVRCHMSGHTENLAYSVSLVGNGVSVENCEIDLDVAALRLAQKVRVTGCNIRYRKAGVVALEGGDILFQGNTVICTATAPLDVDTPLIQAPGARVIGNRFFRPGVTWRNETGSGADRVATLVGAEFRDNRWETDLDVSGRNAGRYFYVQYNGSPARNERFVPPAAIRPFLNAPANHPTPYSSG